MEVAATVSYADMQAVYVLWLRHLKRFARAPSRILGFIAQPVFFLFILGFGFSGAIFPGMAGDYLVFLAPGVITMAILMSSMFAGVSVLWDRQFGFLQEVLVAPVSRFSIVVGRTFGGATMALFQGFLILGLSLFLGVTVTSVTSFAITLLMMILLSFTAVGFGLIIASIIKDFEGLQVVLNLILLPLFFLSSAFFPIDEGVPSWLQLIAHANPLLYMVDGMRGSLTGVNNLYPPLVDLGIVFVLCIVVMVLGSYLFSRSEA